jgi:hypothetical protein
VVWSIAGAGSVHLLATSSGGILAAAVSAHLTELPLGLLYLPRLRNRWSVGQLRTRCEPAGRLLDIAPRGQCALGDFDDVADVDGLLGR